MAGRVLEAKAIITAEDRASKVFAELEKRAKSLEGHFKAMNKAAGGGALGSFFGRVEHGSTTSFARLERTQAMLARSIDRMERSVRTLGRSPIARAGHGASHGLGFGLGIGAGFEAAQIAHEAVRSSMDRVHEQARMRMSGMSADEVKRATVDAAVLSARNPLIGTTESLHQLRNARSVLGSYDEAAHLMPDLMRLRVIAQAARPGADVSEDFDQLIKGLEIKGVTQNPKVFKEYLEGISKGLQVFGDTLKPYQYYEMFKYGRQATPGLSSNFILSTAPTLAQELGGSSYGNAVSGFNRAIVGGRMEHASIKEMARLGLLHHDDVDWLKTGEAKGIKPGRAIQGWELAQSDPNAWIRKFLLPALADHGIIDGKDIMREIGVLFSNRMAAQMVSLLATQQTRIDKDAGLIHGAMGLKGAEYAARNDPTLAWSALKESFLSLTGTLGADLAKDLAPMMSDLAGAIARLTEAIEKNKAEPPHDSEVTKRSRRALNSILFGVDSEKSPFDVTADEKQDALYARRRSQLDSMMRRTDPKAVKRWADYHGYDEYKSNIDPNSFEGKQIRRMEEEETHPYAMGARQLLDELDRSHRAKIAARTRLGALNSFIDHQAFLTSRRMGGLSPYIAGDGTEAPTFTGLGIGRRGGFGGLDPMTGMPKHFGPDLPPPAGAHGFVPNTPDLSALLGQTREVKSDLAAIGNAKVAPQIDASSLAALNAQISQALAGLSRLNGAASAAQRSINTMPMNLGQSAPGTGPAGRTPSGK